MAQTAAQRQARRRAHLRGDHSQCGPRCPGVAGYAPASTEMADATEAYLDGTETVANVVAQLLVSAARAVDQAPGPGTIRAYGDLLRTAEFVRKRGIIPIN